MSRRVREPVNISTMTHIRAGIGRKIAKDERVRKRKKEARRPFLFHRDPAVNLTDPERSASFIKSVAASRESVRKPVRSFAYQYAQEEYAQHASPSISIRKHCLVPLGSRLAEQTPIVVRIFHSFSRKCRCVGKYHKLREHALRNGK